MMTTDEAAARLHVSPARVRQLVLDGRLPAEKVGRDLMLRERDIDDFDFSRGGRGMKKTDDHTVTDIRSTGPLRRVKVRRYPDGKVWITIYGAGQRFAITSAYLDRKGGAELTIVPVRT